VLGGVSLIVAVKRTAVLLVAFAVAACTNQPPPQPVPKVHGLTAIYDTAVGSNHVVTVVAVSAASASVVAKASFARRTTLPPLQCLHGFNCARQIEPPYISASKDRIYVLDGDSTIKEIGTGGAVRTVMSLSVPTDHRASFAVSPDNSQIALAIIDFEKPWPVSEVLYVEPLGGGARINLMTPAVGANSGLYWPVGWRDGKVVFATGSPYVGNERWNPYSALGYALLDPVPTAQPAAISPRNCLPIGLVSAGGTACADIGVARCSFPVATPGYDSCYWRLDWAGVQTVFSLPHVKSAAPVYGDSAALSPDGRTIVTSRLVFGTPAGGPAACCSRLAPARFEPNSDRDVGWIDATHVTWSYANFDGTSGMGIIALDSGYTDAQNIVIQGPKLTGQLVATLPGGL
jgi:hypothetical protein